MLIGIDPILNPSLLHALRAMGHGDEIAIVDANFPAHSCHDKVIRIDGVNATRLLEAILSVMPLDHFIEDPVNTMQVVNDPKSVPPVVQEFADTVLRNVSHSIKMHSLERFEFYERTQSSYAVVQSGEERLYGNIILTKGVIKPIEPSSLQ